MPTPDGTVPFHVSIAIDVADIPDDIRAEVLEDERAKGREMRRLGHLERIWRVPGNGSSVSVWHARDRAHLTILLDALPIAPWTRFDVFELAPHPLESETIDAD